MLSNFLLIVLTSIIINFFLIYISKKLNLLDFPNDRKIHNIPTPYTGGISISLSYLFISFIFKEEVFFINQIIIYSSLIGFLTLIDDKFELKPILKIFLQIIPVLILIYNIGYLKDIGTYDLFGFVYFGNFGIIITVLACLLLINAFNYSDGLDGLLSSIYLVIIIDLIFLLNLFEKNNNIIEYYTYLIFPVIKFLFFNFEIFKSQKIFLGDSGSNFFGLFTAFSIIAFYIFLEIHPSLLMWPLAYLVYEFLTTNLNRLMNKKKIFKPGLDHLHYELMRTFNLNKYEVLVIILSLNILFCLFGYIIFINFDTLISLICFVLLFAIYAFFKKKYLR